MKRSLFILFALLTTVGAVTSGVRHTLEKALINEREAAARYDACAQRAVEEGYPGAASLFRAAARAERVHASRIEQAMRDRGVAIPEPVALGPSVGSTAENLRQSVLMETAERDVFYRNAVESVEKGGDEALLKMFDQTRDTEVEHANLMQSALRQLDKLKEPQTFYVCDDCGYTTDVDLSLCPLCRTRGHRHAVE